VVSKHNKDQFKDVLSEMGMSPEEQHAAVMNAANVPLSEFEGEYQGIGTYESPAAQRLKKVMWESRMRKEMPEEGKNNFLWNTEE
jgi:hypothetical protein